MKIRPVGGELFHADGQTDKVNSRFSQFRESAWKSYGLYAAAVTKTPIIHHMRKMQVLMLHNMVNIVTTRL